MLYFLIISGQWRGGEPWIEGLVGDCLVGDCLNLSEMWADRAEFLCSILCDVKKITGVVNSLRGLRTIHCHIIGLIELIVM